MMCARSKSRRILASLLYFGLLTLVCSDRASGQVPYFALEGGSALLDVYSDAGERPDLKGPAAGLSRISTLGQAAELFANQQKTIQDWTKFALETAQTRSPWGLAATTAIGTICATCVDRFNEGASSYLTSGLPGRFDLDKFNREREERLANYDRKVSPEFFASYDAWQREQLERGLLRKGQWDVSTSSSGSFTSVVVSLRPAPGPLAGNPFALTPGAGKLSSNVAQASGTASADIPKRLIGYSPAQLREWEAQREARARAAAAQLALERRMRDRAENDAYARALSAEQERRAQAAGLLMASLMGQVALGAIGDTPMGYRLRKMHNRDLQNGMMTALNELAAPSALPAPVQARTREATPAVSGRGGRLGGYCMGPDPMADCLPQSGGFTQP